jgi:hypothetical protein
MMPWAGFFIITRSALFLARWEGSESRLQSVTKGRCSPHPPRGPSFVLLHLYAAPQDVGFRVWYRPGAVGYFLPYRTFGYAGSWI